MEETLNHILSELQNLEKGQKKLLTCTKNINKGHNELISGQQQLKIRLDNLEINIDLLVLGQNEIKELLKKISAYMTGRLSISERIMMEIDLLNEKERQDVLNNINEKTFLRKNNTCWDYEEDDMYNDYE
jgi:hypothetical protein